MANEPHGEIRAPDGWLMAWGPDETTPLCVKCWDADGVLQWMGHGDFSDEVLDRARRSFLAGHRGGQQLEMSL